MKRFRALLLFLMLTGAAGAQSVTVTPASTTYVSGGGTLSLTVALAYSNALSTLGFEVTGLPSGWTYASGSGPNLPQIRPSAGDTGTLGFAFTSVPEGAATFSFVVNYPAGMTGTRTISGMTGLFRPLDGALQRVAAPNLVISPPGGGDPGGPPVATPPSIVTQPVGGNLTTGQAIVLAVVATGTAPLAYQWRKDGAVLDGATAATLALNAVSAADAGAYTVVVANSAGNATSSAATVNVSAPPPPPPPPPPTAPQIVTAPIAATVVAGGTATFSVTATGTAPLQYQWRRDGTPLAGATGAALTLTGVAAAQAGVYTVSVTNAAGTVVSAGARLTVEPVTPPPPPPPPAGGVAGTYFGTIGGAGGTFALQVRADRSGVLLAYARAAGLALVSRTVQVDEAGRFSVSTPSLLAAAGGAGTPPVAAAAGDVVVSGAISAARTVTGTIGGSSATLSAPAPAAAGASAAAAGFYQAGAPGSADTAFVVVGEAGDVFLLASIGGRFDAGRGTVSGNGALEIVTEANARVGGVVAAQLGTITATVAPAAGTASTLVGANTLRSDTEKLVNISTRSPVGGTAGALIAGFVVSGTRPKPMLVRAIGPTLASFGVDGALEAAALEVFRGEVRVAAAGDWGAGPSAGGIAAAAARVGAFALAADSRDAAVLVNLEPGAYTAVVRGQGSAAGVGLVEVYDATEGAIPAAQRIVNVSTRSRAGTGDASLIAGFNLSGAVPKRVLIRGIGPGLVPFGVGGALARPQIEVFQDRSVLARNSGWGSGDAASVAAATAGVGAFALAAGSADAALLINLMPGSYTVHLSGLGGTVGEGLIEIYEVP